MHLKISKRNGRAYLSIVQSYRSGGKVRTKTVRSIGYADAYQDEFEDPIAHFKEHVRQLNEAQSGEEAAVEFSLLRNATIEENQAPTARWGAALALAHLDALGISAFFNARSRRANTPSHAGRVFEMLATERMMHVSPKRETWQKRASFPRACDFSLEEAYAALEVFAREESALVRAMESAYQSNCQPYKTSCIYVVFNAFKFPRAGTADAPRSLTTGLAVVLDREGMPITYRLIESKLEPDEVAPLIASIKEEVGAKRAVVITEALAQPHRVACLLAAQGDGLVLHQAAAQRDEDSLAWAEDPRGYTASASGAYKAKSRLIAWSDPESNANVRMKELVLWSRNFTVSGDDPRIKAERPASHEKTPATSLDAQSGGSLCVITTETNLPAASIFHLYREVWRLTEPFQVMESDFSPLPYPIARKDHVKAHFLICFAAFFAMRVLRSNMGWTYNAAQVAEALLRMEGNRLQENWFLFSYRSPVTDAIEEASGVEVARRLRTQNELRTATARTCRNLTKS